MERVLVTGANGFLATHAIMQFLSEGYVVRGVLRNPAAYAGERSSALELCAGDFTSPDFMRQAVKGCDYIVHCAAMTGQNGERREYQRVNVRATECLVRIAIEYNVKKFVYVSSANTFAFGGKAFPGDETRPLCKPFSSSDYAASKAEAQDLVMTYRDRIEVVVVNPAFMLGAYAAKQGSGRIVLMGCRKKIIFYPPGGKNFVHVGDVAKGILQALNVGKNGEAYLLANENMSYRDFFALLCECSGQKAVFIQIPGFLLRMAGCIGSLFSLIGFRSDINLTNMRILCVKNYYTNLKSVSTLNMVYRPVRRAVSDTLEWFNSKSVPAAVRKTNIG